MTLALRLPRWTGACACRPSRPGSAALAVSALPPPSAAAPMLVAMRRSPMVRSTWSQTSLSTARASAPSRRPTSCGAAMSGIRSTASRSIAAVSAQVRSTSSRRSSRPRCWATSSSRSSASATSFRRRASFSVVFAPVSGRPRLCIPMCLIWDGFQGLQLGRSCNKFHLPRPPARKDPRTFTPVFSMAYKTIREHSQKNGAELAAPPQAPQHPRLAGWQAFQVRIPLAHV